MKNLKERKFNFTWLCISELSPLHINFISSGSVDRGYFITVAL